MWVLGSGGFAPERTDRTSVALELVHRAQCSVRVVRPPLPGAGGPIRLVIGNNGSKACEAVIDEVARRRWPPDTEAHILTVVVAAASQEERQRAITNAEEEWLHRLQRAGVKANRRFLQGDPHHEIVRESENWNAGAIFIGPRSVPAAGRFLLGSVATAVVTRARSTVEVVRKRAGS